MNKDKMPLAEIRRILKNGSWYWEHLPFKNFENPEPWQVELDSAIEAALDKLQAYHDAEAEGRLVRLPCKPGDPIFSHWSWCMPLKTHKCGEIWIGEYIVTTAGMMFTRDGVVKPFVCFGSGWGGICYEKPLDEIKGKCAFTLDEAFKQAQKEREAKRNGQTDTPQS